MTNTTARAAHSAADVANLLRLAAKVIEHRATSGAELQIVAQMRKAAQGLRLTPSEWAEAVERAAAKLWQGTDDEPHDWPEESFDPDNDRRKADACLRAAFPHLAPTEDSSR